MRSLRTPSAVIVLVFACLVGAAAPAFAGAAGSCSGKTSGMCLWRDAEFVPPWGWYTKNVNVSNMGYFTYYGTGSSMNDSVSSAKNLGACTSYMYWDADFANGPTNGPIVFPARTQLQNFGSYWNDEASSVYWNC